VAFILADRVKETTPSVGTASGFTLTGAGTSFVAFGSVMSDADQTFYAAIDYANGDWEIGVGQYVLSTNRLNRVSVIQSSNADAKVDFQSGTKYVFITYPADKSVHLDQNGFINQGNFGANNITTSGNISATGTGTVSGANINDTAWDAHVASVNPHIDWTAASSNFATSGTAKIDGVTYFMNGTLTVDDKFYAGSVDVNTPVINFDTNDYVQYDRAADRYRILIGATSQFSLTATVADFHDNTIQTSGDVSGGTIGGITESGLVDSTADEGISGNWTFTGTQTLSGLTIHSPTAGITAYATGGQTNATLLTKNYNQISICNTSGDSVKLPVAVAGYKITVINSGVASCDVFPNTSDAIDSAGTNNAVALASGTNATYYAYNNSNWVTLV
jgi:hypothetical protein